MPNPEQLGPRMEKEQKPTIFLDSVSQWMKRHPNITKLAGGMITSIALVPRAQIAWAQEATTDQPVNQAQTEILSQEQLRAKTRALQEAVVEVLSPTRMTSQTQQLPDGTTTTTKTVEVPSLLEPVRAIKDPAQNPEKPGVTILQEDLQQANERFQNLGFSEEQIKQIAEKLGYDFTTIDEATNPDTPIGQAIDVITKCLNMTRDHVDKIGVSADQLEPIEQWLILEFFKTSIEIEMEQRQALPSEEQAPIETAEIPSQNQ